MAQKKKLQVFISSTYTDLQEERQSAVQAILTAGHIPAGMELFAAGDETQMNVIKRWIDESDVYMLILGGRYGSIEPKSGKSYIHLEYEYAIEKNKPLFAVVIDESYLEEKVKKDGLKAIEKDHSEKLKDFRDLVCSKMVRFWKDAKDIKLSIMETMADFSSREELIGWIPGNEAINTGAIAEELANLVKENNELREKISQSSKPQSTYSGLTFDEMYKLLSAYEISINDLESQKNDRIKFDVVQDLAMHLGEAKTTLLQFYWLSQEMIRQYSLYNMRAGKLHRKLMEFGLLESVEGNIQFTETGRQFLLRLKLEDKFREAEYLYF